MTCGVDGQRITRSSVRVLPSWLGTPCCLWPSSVSWGEGMNGHLPLSTLSQISRRVAHAIGTMGLVGGQVMDITQASSDRQISTLETTCLMKTGSLIQVSLECGALLAETDPETTQALSDYGKALGLAFQITDDILNVVGDSRTMGKAIKTDASHQK